jgi:hypothetical protein
MKRQKRRMRSVGRQAFALNNRRLAHQGRLRRNLPEVAAASAAQSAAVLAEYLARNMI